MRHFKPTLAFVACALAMSERVRLPEGGPCNKGMPVGCSGVGGSRRVGPSAGHVGAGEAKLVTEPARTHARTSTPPPPAQVEATVSKVAMWLVSTVVVGAWGVPRGVPREVPARMLGGAC